MKLKVYQCKSCDEIVRQLVVYCGKYDYQGDKPLTYDKLKVAIDSGYLKPHKVYGCKSCEYKPTPYSLNFEGL